jgi:hypothetical protein
MMTIPARTKRTPRHVVAPQRTFRARHGWLHLASSGWYVDVDEVRAEPELTQLMSADACWFLAYQDWAGRRPRRWQLAAWRSWRREELALALEQVGLVRAAFGWASLRPQASS